MRNSFHTEVSGLSGASNSGIVLEVTFKISDQKKRYLEQLIAFMNYEKPSVSKETLMIDDIDEIHQDEETNENLVILVDEVKGEA